jgi:hypothetical protein
VGGGAGVGAGAGVGVVLQTQSAAGQYGGTALQLELHQPSVTVEPATLWHTFLLDATAKQSTAIANLAILKLLPLPPGELPKIDSATDRLRRKRQGTYRDPESLRGYDRIVISRYGFIELSDTGIGCFSSPT